MNKEFNFTMRQKLPDLRTCIVDGEKALFHRWSEYAAVIEPSPMIGGHPGGQLRETLAIVELESGQVKEVKPSKVVFTDTIERMHVDVLNLKSVIENEGGANNGE